MRVVNGFTIIATQDTIDDMVVILGARQVNFTESGFEYVTAFMHDIDQPEWIWGHYFDRIRPALDDFTKRTD